MIYHLRIDVENFLRHSGIRQFRGLLRDDAGRSLPPDEAKAWFVGELAKGRRFIPFGKCDNFDDERGCQGHPDDPRPRVSFSADRDEYGNPEGVIGGGIAR